MTAVQYPGYGVSNAVAGPNLGWARDTMGRLNTMTDLASQASIVSATTYGPSNELLTMSGVMTETRTYNSMLQLTSLYSNSAGGLVNVTYNYSSTQNNGKIASQTDNVSGEQVVYAYDALNRLASAVATSNSWGQSYSYDGFGNLTDQTVIAGTAPAYHVVPDPNTNHLGSVDANGNTLITNGFYDVENRFTGTLAAGGMVPGNYQYSYAPGNKRVWRGVVGVSGGVTTLTTDEVTFWSVTGQKLASYNIVLPGGNGPGTPPSIVFQLNVANYYFGGKLVGHYANGGRSAISSDHLGSIGKFYPYGQEKSATQNGTEKFTGYFRDSETGFDYADQRYHNPGTGRFLPPDPAMSSAGPADPGSWNRYAYTRGDPVNRVDRRGRDDEFVAQCGLDEYCGEDPCEDGDWEDCPYGGGGGSSGGGGCSSPNTQGGGKKNKPIKITPSTTSKQAMTVQKDLQTLEGLIDADPNCWNWLNSGGQNPDTAINFILGLPGTGATGVTAGVGTFSPSDDNAVEGTNGTNLPPGSMLITVNVNGAFFNAGVGVGFGLPAWLSNAGGTVAAQYEILLHELAHVTQANNFISGDSSESDQTKNNQAVMANCGDIVNAAGGH